MKVVTGNVLDSNADVIIHQVNCQGVMGSGVAKQVKDRYPVVYEMYKAKCNEYKTFADMDINPLLGFAQICYKENYPVTDVKDKQVIVNLFSQNHYGHSGVYTDYDAMRKGLESINQQFAGSTVAVPYLMGCCRGGGDWKIVAKIIHESLKDCDVTAYHWAE